MKIEVNIEKKYALAILSVLLLIGIGVYAYTYSSQIPNPGHGADTVWVNVNGSEMTLQEAIINGKIGWNSSSSSGTSTGNTQIYYNNSGNPGITFTPLSSGQYLVEVSGAIEASGEYGGACWMTLNGAQLGQQIPAGHRDAGSGGNTYGNYPFYDSASTGTLSSGTPVTLSLTGVGGCVLSGTPWGYALPPFFWKITKLS